MPGQKPGYRVTRVWVGVAISANGDEMPAAMVGGGLHGMPLFTTDERNLPPMREIAEHVGRMNNERIEIREFIPAP